MSYKTGWPLLFTTLILSYEPHWSVGKLQQRCCHLGCLIQAGEEVGPPVKFSVGLHNIHCNKMRGEGGS